MSPRIVGALALVASLLTVAVAAAESDVPAPTPIPAVAAAPAAAAAPTWLAPPAPAPSVGKADSPRSSWRSIAVLLLVGVVGGGAYYIKRKKRTQIPVPEEARLRVVESVRVSPRAQVVLTSVNGRLLLLGVTDRSVRRIAWVGRGAERPRTTLAQELARDEESVPTRAQPVVATTPPRPFQAMLNALRSSSLPPANEMPAVQIAEETRDIYESRTSAPPNVTLRSFDAIVGTGTPIEGQVANLRKRTPKRKT